MNMTDSAPTLKPRFGRATIAVLAIAFYGIFLFARPFVRARFGLELGPDPSLLSRLTLGYVWMWGPALVLALILFELRQVPQALGLRGPIVPALIFAFATTLPVLLYYGIAGNLDGDVSLWTAAIPFSALPAFFEELLFRALVFGFLFRFARWGFLPAELLSAVLFGVAHLSQGNSVAGAAAVVAVTAFGALWFSWLYVEWRYNLWVPIFVHFFLNFYWAAFDIAGSAAGNLPSNILRIVVILLTIVVTVWYARRKGGRIITGTVWWTLSRPVSNG